MSKHLWDMSIDELSEVLCVECKMSDMANEACISYMKNNEAICCNCCNCGSC